jgi:ankyrin repeat protein
MKIPCSNCNQRLEIPEELAGQTIECPACKASLAVPTMAAPPPPPAPVQESAPQAATSKKSISSIPKWAIASIAGIAVVVVGLIMFSPDTAVKTDDESQRPSPQAETKPVEPVAEAAKPETPTAKAPDISIHEAAGAGNIEAVKQHLAAGTDVNAKGLGGSTPLHEAAYYGRKEIMELLIASGADANAKDYYGGRTPLDVATHSKHPNASAETADLLRKHGGKTGEELKGDEPVSKAATPEPPKGKAPDISIHLAVLVGNIEGVKQHLAAGTDVNLISDGIEKTALHSAVQVGHKEITELLIDNGANVNAKNRIGETPLHQAVSREVVELLIANKAKVNTLSRLGATPLDTAILRKQPEITDLLRKHGGKTKKELEAEGK